MSTAYLLHLLNSYIVHTSLHQTNHVPVVEIIQEYYATVVDVHDFSRLYSYLLSSTQTDSVFPINIHAMLGFSTWKILPRLCMDHSWMVPTRMVES